MKILVQFGIIFGVCWVGYAISAALPFSFPSSVISMLLLLLLLLFGVLKVDHIRAKSNFLLSNMAFFFIPAGVNIINYFDILKSSFVQIFIICVISTLLTFAATAYSIRFTLYLMNRRRAK
ncbi:MAG: CidA/LrgA family protein [Clostridia bacterium]|nr:CidA/LrgA family protein [Clostridia bacterium]NLS85953.1 CidA/LrgA family protein [Oscillospiraceae bacterium]